MNDSMFQRRCSFSGQYPGPLFIHGIPVLLMDHSIPKVRISLVVFRGIAGHRSTTRTMDGGDRTAVPDVHRVDIVRDRVEKLLVALFAFSCRFPRPLARGDVMADS